MKPSGIGGMAVMEGVMMKNKEEYAVAVRKPNNEIAVEISTHKDFSDKVKLFKLPVFRGMLAFVDSMVIGVKVLNYSASFFEEEEETQNKKDKDKKKQPKNDKNFDDDFEMEEVAITKTEIKSQNSVSSEVTKDQKNNKDEKISKDEKSNALLMIFAVLFSIVLSVSLFMVLPVFLTKIFESFVKNSILIALIEGIIRLAIFIGYVILASKMPEIKRVFMYHGAEHKTINCLENGIELTVENVKWQSKQHKRCGTSFMLLVILISLVFFMVVPVSDLFWKVISRVVLVPFIAGVSYEFIRLAGKNESKLVDILSQPGLWMQGLTTKEPDDSMIEVAIQSVGAVFDWRTFVETTAAEEKNAKKNSNVKNITATKQQTSGKQKPAAKPQPSGKQQPSDKRNATVSTSSVKPKVVSQETIKKETTVKKDASVMTTTINASVQTTPSDTNRRNPGTAPVAFKPVIPNKLDEEDDDILKALDKFFDGPKDSGKTGEA